MVRYTLQEPVQFGSETITELELQSLKAKHLRGLTDKPAMGDMLDLVGKIAGQPKPVIDELSAADALRLVEIVGGFLQSSRATGNSASE